MKLKVLRNNKKKHTFRYILLGVGFVALMACAVFSIDNVYSRISQKKEELAALRNEIKIQEIKNSELEHVLNYSDEEYLEYVISKARGDLDYVKQGERVFVNSAGD